MRRHTVYFAIVVFLGLCLYIPLLTKNYDINGLAEAEALEVGAAEELWNPNHMLYRPVGSAIWQGLASAGAPVAPIPFLQILSAVFGALGLGFAYLTLERLTANRTIAIWMSLALGVSWSYWTLSTDVYYFSMAAMLVAACLAVFVYSESDRSMTVCGMLAGLSILACQADVVLIPALGIAVLLRSPSPLRLKPALRSIFQIWKGAGLVIGTAFLGAGVVVHGHRTIGEVLRWGLQYSDTHLPIWGAWWPPSRFLQAVGSAFNSVLSTDLSTLPFFLRHLENGRLPEWVAQLAFAIMAAGLIAAFRKGPIQRSSETRTALWLLVLYVSYLPFVAWWEPIEPRWFILPNVFLAALAGMIWARWWNWPYVKFAVPACVVILGVVNLATSAAPKRFTESSNVQIAACVAAHLQEDDLFLATEWNWSGYLQYVHNRRFVSFIGEVAAAGDTTAALEKIDQIVKENQARGGEVYMTDIRSYSPEYMQWLKETTGLTADDLDNYEGSQAFECVYSNFIRLNQRTLDAKETR